MKETKRRLTFFKIYDREGMEEHLAGMARKGWMLTKIENIYWHYRRIEPKDIRFSVCYSSAIPNETLWREEDRATFREYCAHCGWEFLTSTEAMQVFYTEKADAVPMQTDVASDLDCIHRSVKKSTLRTWIVLGILSWLYIALFIFKLFTLPHKIIANPLYWFTFVFYLFMALATSVDLVMYILWYRKAKKAAEQGIALTAKRHRGYMFLRTNYIWLITLVFLVFGTNLMRIIFLSILLLAFLALPVMREVSHAHRNGKLVLEFIGVLIVVVGVALGAIMIGGFVESLHKETIQYPFTVSDLTDGEENGYTTNYYGDETWMAKSCGMEQIATGDLPDLEYTLLYVKMPFLYDFCLDGMLDEDYDSVDPAAWGADAAWRLYEDDVAQNRYIVCYGKYILSIAYDGLTDGKKQMIGKSITG